MGFAMGFVKKQKYKKKGTDVVDHQEVGGQEGCAGEDVQRVSAMGGHVAPRIFTKNPAIMVLGMVRRKL